MTTAEKLSSSALLAALVAVAMGALRDLGYALEPLVDREVRASGKEELAGEIQAALVEIDESAAVEMLDNYIEIDLDEFEPGDEPDSAPASSADPLVVQILSWPYMPGLRRHDLIIDPKQSVIGRLKYKKITMRRARELASQGRRFNKKYSNSPELE